MAGSQTHDRAATIEALRDVWTSTTELIDTLGPADWDLPTDCPGWTVRDQLAHLAAFEHALAGHPLPEHQVAAMPDWVRNELGRANENAVDHWRSRPVAELVATWRETVSERLTQLEAATDAELSAESWTPMGPGTVLDLMQSRILDHWLHEQDIRRAVARPGHQDGPAAEHTVDRLLAGLPMVIGKRAAAPEGACAVVQLTGPVRRATAITVRDGRATPGDRPTDPAVTLTLDSTLYTELAGGRLDPATALADGGVTVHGDAALGRAIVTNLNIMI